MLNFQCNLHFSFWYFLIAQLTGTEPRSMKSWPQPCTLWLQNCIYEWKLSWEEWYQQKHTFLSLEILSSWAFTTLICCSVMAVSFPIWDRIFMVPCFRSSNTIISCSKSFLSFNATSFSRLIWFSDFVTESWSVLTSEFFAVAREIYLLKKYKYKWKIYLYQKIGKLAVMNNYVDEKATQKATDS